MEKKILAFRQLSKGWDSYGADPPNEAVIQRALSLAQRLTPDRVEPSRIGGCALFWVEDQREALIEFSNRHEHAILMLSEGEQVVDVFCNRTDEEIIEKVKTFFPDRPKGV